MRKFDSAPRGIVFLSITLIYFLLGYVGLQLATINNNASPIWPASGFAIGALMLCGKRFFPAIFVGSFLTNLSVSTPWSALVAMALGNMLEAYVGTTIINWGLRKNYFKHYSELITLFFASTFAATISASLGSFTLYHSGTTGSLGYSWYTWWSGNVIGILVIVPLFLEIGYRTRKHRPSTKKIFPAAVFALGMLGSLYSFFIYNLNQSFSWALSPFFIIAGLTYGRLFSRTLLVLVSILIITLTSQGYSPFEQGNLNLNLLYVQSLLASYSLAILFVRPLNTDHKFSYRYLLGMILAWISLFVFIYQTSENEIDHSVDDFNKTTDIAMSSIQNSTKRYESLLTGAATLFMIRPETTEEEWRTYVASLGIRNYFDAIKGLGFISMVPSAELEAFSRKNNLKPFTIGPQKKDTNGVHYILKYIEPQENNAQARGLDVGSEESRREKIEEVIKTGKVLSTEMVQLVRDQGERQSFIIFKSVRNLAGNLIGLINAPVISNDFFTANFAPLKHIFRYRVSHEGKTVHETNEAPNYSYKKDRYYIKKEINLFGITYKVEFYPTHHFFSRHSGNTALVSLLLSIFMLFISAFLLEQLTFNQRAEVLIEQRTKELEVSKMQLINSSKMASLGEMASGMAHEINNPLAIIQGKVKVITLMLEDAKIHNPKLFQEIEKIKLTTDRIEKIVKGLRNFSRASSNDPFEPIPLKKILTETLDLCAEKLKVEGVNLVIREVPEVSILCRPSQISQVFVNLLNNSSDALEGNSVKWIEIEFRTSVDMVQISFTDSGIGIPKEIADKIMEPFFTTKEVRKGTGLGLSIARGIVDSHKGNLWLDSNHPNTRFVIELRKA